MLPRKQRGNPPSVACNSPWWSCSVATDKAIGDCPPPGHPCDRVRVLLLLISRRQMPHHLTLALSVGLSRRDRSARRTSVVIDFSGQLKGLEASALAYSDLSVEGKTDEAAKGLFRALRWAETQPSAQRLLIAGAYCQYPDRLARSVSFVVKPWFRTCFFSKAFAPVPITVVYGCHASRESQIFCNVATAVVLWCISTNSSIQHEPLSRLFVSI